MLEGPNMLDLKLVQDQDLVPADHLVVVVKRAAARELAQACRLQARRCLQLVLLYYSVIVERDWLLYLIEHEGFLLTQEHIGMFLLGDLHLLQNVQDCERRECLLD